MLYLDYRVTYYEEQNFEIARQKIINYYLQRMKNYHCDGCRYCCYGIESYKDRCDKTFTSGDQLSEYITLLNDNDEDTHRWFIEKISFIDNREGGYTDDKEIVWTINNYLSDTKETVETDTKENSKKESDNLE